MNKVISVTFSASAVATAYGIWQHDYGQTLEIHGLAGLLPQTPVHYGAAGAAVAETRMGTYADGILQARIAQLEAENATLQKGKIEIPKKQMEV